MVKKPEFEDWDTNIPLLIDYLDGKLDKEATLQIRNELRENEELRRDMYFLIEARTEMTTREDCPSLALLTSYHFGIVELGDEVEQHLENHIKSCGPCQKLMKRITEFDRGTEKARKQLFKNGRTVTGLTEFLREIGKSYLEEGIVNSLVDKLDELTEKGLEERLEPVALGFAEEYSLSKEEKEYLNIVRDLFPAKDKLDELIENGGEKEFKKKLQELIQDEELAEKVIEKISESIVKKNLDRIESNEPETVMDILRRLSEQYLDSDLADRLLDEIKNIDFGKREQVPQMGLGLSGDTSKELLGKEKDFLEIAKGVMSEKDEIDTLIQEGDRKEIKSKLLDVLDDEELVDVVMNLYREAYE